MEKEPVFIRDRLSESKQKEPVLKRGWPKEALSSESLSISITGSTVEV
jgi:hypothetical protein